MNRFFSSIGAIMAIPLLESCAPQSDADAGISPGEARELQKNYYWTPAEGEFDRREDSLRKIMAGTPARMEMGGEKAELQASRLILALASVGDRPFSEELKKQPEEIQRAVLDAIRSAWSYSHLEYPLTQGMGKGLQGRGQETSDT